MLAEAVRREPDNVRYSYVLAVALHDGGRPDEALGVLRNALAYHPNDPQLREAFVAFARPPA
jgi:cytochrome c-type biogenesis protein CcmH/NrfG